MLPMPWISAMANHLWQSTLVVLAAWLFTLALRNHQARIRYWIWLIASLKFLLPFSLLTSLGRLIGWPFLSIQTSHLDGIYELSAPISSSAMTVGPETAHSTMSSWISGALLCVWLLGSIFVVISWWAAWRRARMALGTSVIVQNEWEHQILRHLQESTGMRAKVQLAYSSLPLEPGVYGVLRPTILLPIGIRTFLSKMHLEALLAHELTHIRRHDNLVASIQMLVQAIFWFNPLVWWLGARMLDERERACDEEVLRLGSDPHIYAESILRVCRFCVACPSACVAGVTGSDLKRRVEEIMSRSFGQELNRGKKALLAVVLVTGLTVPIMVGMTETPGLKTQSLDPAIAASSKFEVAAIKSSKPGTGLRVQFTPSGRVVIQNATLRFLIKIAYDVGDQQIEGGPAWINSKRFDLEAKPGETAMGDLKDMSEEQRKEFREQDHIRLQNLLADRFGLKLRRESRQMPIYAMVVAKNGPKMRQAVDDDGRSGIVGGTGQVSATRVGMEAFAHFLGEQAGRPVLDMTGLTGNYNFALKWSPDTNQTAGVPDAANNIPAGDSSGPTLFTAIQDQLGLKLEAQKSPAEILIVDRAEKPSAN